MKKISVLIIVMVLMVSFCACTANKLAEDYSEDQVISRGKEVVEIINIYDYDAIVSQFRDDLQEQITAETLKDAWDKKLTEAGAFKEYKSVVTGGQKSKSTDEDYAMAVLTCVYEQDTLIYTVVMDANYDIVGLYMK